MTMAMTMAMTTMLLLLMIMMIMKDENDENDDEAAQRSKAGLRLSGPGKGLFWEEISLL